MFYYINFKGCVYWRGAFIREGRSPANFHLQARRLLDNLQYVNQAEDGPYDCVHFYMQV